MGNSRLHFHEKSYVRGRRFLQKLKIWYVDDPQYKDGIKYSLIFLDLKTGRRVLLDNHHPKSHHIYLDDKEVA